MAALTADEDRDYGELELEDEIVTSLSRFEDIGFKVSAEEWKHGVDPAPDLNFSAAGAGNSASKRLERTSRSATRRHVFTARKIEFMARSVAIRLYPAMREPVKPCRNPVLAIDRPLAEVAERTGFKHQEYLGAVLKARLSCSPAQFRKRT